MNAVMIYPNQRARFAQCNSYTIDVDCGNKNCYSCREFSHLARNYRNRKNRTGEGRRMEYGQKLMIEEGNEQGNSNLNEERDLIIFN